jgi:hypothetical protein
VASWEDVGRLAQALPEVREEPRRVWRVRGKAFLLERPLRRADLAFLAGRAPDEAPLALWATWG